MEIVIVCLVACVICVAAVLVTNHTATQKGYTKGVQDGIQQRKQQAEAEIGSAEKEAARVIHDAKKEAEQQKKSVLLEAKDEVFQLRADAEKEIKDRRSEVSNEEYSRKKNLWTKNWKTSNAKRTIFPANKKAWKNGLQKPKPSRIARWMFWNESQNSLGNRQRNTSCNIWKTNWCMKRQ